MPKMFSDTKCCNYEQCFEVGDIDSKPDPPLNSRCRSIPARKGFQEKIFVLNGHRVSLRQSRYQNGFADKGV